MPNIIYVMIESGMREHGSDEFYIKTFLLVPAIAAFFNVHRLQKSGQKIYDQAESARYRGDDPKTHGDLGFRPAQRLQMMMDRRGKEYLPAQQTLGQKLDDDRSGFQNQDESDDRQEKDGIGEEGDDRERHGQSHDPGLAHVKTGGMHVEP